MSTHEEQIASLTEKLNALENESRKLLQAVHWSSKVRLILFVALLAFVLISAFLFYRLYNEIRYERVAEVQRIISEQPEEFSQPLTRQLMTIAENEGPYVLDIFKQQADADSKLYLSSLETQQQQLVQNLQKNLEDKVVSSYAMMLEEQEQALREEFPILKDPEKLKYVRQNMEEVYEKIGKRYYVDYLKDELEDLTAKLEKFPISQPRQANVPVTEQVATEFLELVRMMLVNSDHYVIPKKTVKATMPIKSKTDTVKKDDGESSEESSDDEGKDEGGGDDDK